MNKEKLKKVYKLYGYRIKEFDSDIITCLYEEGRYFGADIIPLDKKASTISKAETLRDDYSKSGYASNLKKYSNSEQAELELYKSFFSYKSSKKRNKKRYDDFVQKQSKNNGGYNYEYITSPFSLNGELHTNNGITSSINEHLNNPKPQLIIIEAAAGYGKTCTSYELLKNFLNSDSCEIPLMTELSRNRGANIFRYILLDEIDRQYPNLDSKLVKHEIQTGRIPLIIDGFDELLKKSNIVISDKNEVFREVETMLDTIGNLLKGNSKVILTTRKTAIFSSGDFDKWIKKWKKSFEITRYSIEVPKIKNWIGHEKLLKIKSNNIPVEYIANPVLLTYLRNLKNLEFQKILQEPNSIVQTYFEALLKREMERQDLRINPEDQYQIFKNTVRLLIELDTASENQTFLKDIIYDQNKNLLNQATKLYSGNTDLDDLMNKLANHALLDRKGIQDDQIGFINDFIFGTFIGEIMSETDTKTINEKWSSYMVELGVTAYRVQNKDNKFKVWEKINALKERFEQHSLLNFDIALRNSILRNYKDAEFNTMSIFNISFHNKYSLTQSIFVDCVFKNCHFEKNVFKDVTFLNCVFIDCSSDNNIKIDEMKNVKAINCTQTNSDILIFYKQYDNEQLSQLEETENKVLLSIYEGQDKINSILKSVPSANKKMVSQAIETLLKKRVLEVNGLTIKLATNKLGFIKKRLNIK